VGFQLFTGKIFDLDESQRGEQLLKVIYAKDPFLDEYRIIQNTY
jgi:hypothetical protein